MFKWIKIYGERNCGTTYLHQLLQGNLGPILLRGVVPWYIHRTARSVGSAVRAIGGDGWSVQERVKDAWFASTMRFNLGWKHMRPLSGRQLSALSISHDALFLTLTKNPYSWLLSLYRRPYHRGPVVGDLSFTRFLTTPWLPVRRENLDSVAGLTPISLWNLKNRAYLDIAPDLHVMNLTYEQLLSDPESVTMRIAAACGKEIVPRFVNVRNSTKGDAGRDFSTYRDYYLSEKWRPAIDPMSYQVINEGIDKELVTHFGYELIQA